MLLPATLMGMTLPILAGSEMFVRAARSPAGQACSTV